VISTYFARHSATKRRKLIITSIEYSSLCEDNNHSASQGIHLFFKMKSVFRNLAAGLYPEPHESRQHRRILFLVG
jgi:hypothetical protein